MNEYEITVIFHNDVEVTTKFICGYDTSIEQKILQGIRTALGLVNSNELDFDKIKDFKFNVVQYTSKQ